MDNSDEEPVKKVQGEKKEVKGDLKSLTRYELKMLEDPWEKLIKNLPSYKLNANRIKHTTLIDMSAFEE